MKRWRSTFGLLGIASGCLLFYYLSVGPVLQLAQKKKFRNPTVKILRGFYEPVFVLARSSEPALMLYEDYTGFWAKIFRLTFEKTHAFVQGKPVLSPDGEFFVQIDKHGADHTVYSARTRKRIELYVGCPNRPYYPARIYSFTAGNLQSYVEWTTNNFKVIFYEETGMIKSGGAKSAVTASNHIATLRFTQVSKLPFYTIADLDAAGPSGFREEH
jgi:hypothetical protein